MKTKIIEVKNSMVALTRDFQNQIRDYLNYIKTAEEAKGKTLEIRFLKGAKPEVYNWLDQLKQSGEPLSCIVGE